MGCGQGALTRRLRQVVPHVTGIDRDQRSIEIARAHPDAADVRYVLGDFLATPFEPGSLDLISSVASLHHMDAEAALRRMSDLLRPGGAGVVVGLAREGSPADLIPLLPAMIGHRLHLAASAWRLRGSGHDSSQGYASPIVWPPPLTYRQSRRLAERVLPAVAYRRRLYWRYTLVWTKPS